MKLAATIRHVPQERSLRRIVELPPRGTVYQHSYAAGRGTAPPTPGGFVCQVQKGEPETVGGEKFPTRCFFSCDSLVSTRVFRRKRLLA